MNIVESLLRWSDAPERVLLRETDGTVWSYGDIIAAVRAEAARLQADGVRRGDRVLLVLPNGAPYLVAYYATLFVGATVVALPANSTPSYVADIVARVKPATVLTGDRVDPTARATPDATAAPVQRDAADIAQIIFTSGTTGGPKGVQLSHGALRINTAGIAEYLRLTADDRVGVVLEFVYSYGNSLLHTHVLVGGSLALVGSMTFPAEAIRRIREARCTGVSGVPTTLTLLSRSKGLAGLDREGLRYLTCAGGALPTAVTRTLRETLPGTELFLMYGQTEGCARLSYLPPEKVDAKPGSIGQGMPGVTLRVLRPDGSPASVGEEGEIVAQGASLMSGYLDDPEATRDALRDGALWTGDLASMDADGDLFISGRRSDLIKTGAFRVHPLEIEDALASLPGIAEYGVVGVPDDVLGERLVLCVPEGSTITVADVRQHLRGRLPDFKWPAAVVPVSTFPRTISGKLQRKTLVEMLTRK